MLHRSRHLLTWLACAAGTLANHAVAQTTVTLSGVVDLGLRHTRNEGVGSLQALVSGSNATSRLTFTAREDMGGGLWAGMHLEHGFNADSGVPAGANKYFDRRSTVSVGSTRWGELRLGRDFIPSYVNWSRYDVFSYVGVGRSAVFVSGTPLGAIRNAFGTNPNTTVRSDNAVQYMLPGNLGGLEGGLMWAPGEALNLAEGQARLVGARVAYVQPRFSLAAGSTTSHTSQAGVGHLRDTVVGGSFKVADLTFNAARRSFSAGTAKQQLSMLGASYVFGVQELKASWVKSNFSGSVGSTAIGANDSSLWALGWVYNLSRRTAGYVHVAQLANDGGARFVIDGPAVTAAGAGSRAFELGLRHRF